MTLNSIIRHKESQVENAKILLKKGAPSDRCHLEHPMALLCLFGEQAPEKSAEIPERIELVESFHLGLICHRTNA